MTLRYSQTLQNYKIWDCETRIYFLNFDKQSQESIHGIIPECFQGFKSIQRPVCFVIVEDTLHMYNDARSV